MPQYTFIGGDKYFTLQCEACGTITKPNQTCPRCDHPFIKVYPKETKK